jgi:transposase
MKDLWAVEDQVRGLTPDDRSAARRQSSAPIVAELFALWEKELALISGKSKLAEHIRYALERRASLELFLADGRVEIDSNIVERAIRPQTMRESLCSPSSSICKHWKRVRIDNATRASLPGQGRFYRLRREVVGPDLMRCAGNNLHGMKDARFDQASYRMVRDA